MVAPVVGAILRRIVGGAATPGGGGARRRARGPKVKVDVAGVDEVLEILQTVTPRHANKLARSTVRGVAAGIRKDIIATGVVGTTGIMTDKNSVKVRMRRSVPGAHISEVYFANRAFYWRFVEHGTGGATPQPARPFVGPARNRAFGDIEKTFANTFSRVLERSIRRELKKQAKQKRRWGGRR